MALPQSNEYKEFASYDLAAGGFTEVWDATNFSIICLQVRIDGADAADAILEVQSSLNNVNFPTYEAPFVPPVGDSDHMWDIGIHSGRFIRVLITPGSNTTGSVKLYCHGKV